MPAEVNAAAIRGRLAPKAAGRFREAVRIVGNDPAEEYRRYQKFLDCTYPESIASAPNPTIFPPRSPGPAGLGIDSDSPLHATNLDKSAVAIHVPTRLRFFHAGNRRIGILPAAKGGSLSGEQETQTCSQIFI